MTVIKVVYGNNEMEIKNALIGARINDEHDTPTAFYGGVLDLDEIHTALYHSIRACIKILHDEFEIPLDEVDEFVLSAFAEAIVREVNSQNTGSSDVDVQKIVRTRRRSQN